MQVEALRSELPLPPAPPCLMPSAWCLVDRYLPFVASEHTPTFAALVRFRAQHLPALLADPSLAAVSPSLLAAAVIVVANRTLALAPEWPQVLAGVTGLLLLQPPNLPRSRTVLHRLCERIMLTLRLRPFVPSAYQGALAEGLDGMLRMDHRPSMLASTVSPECALIPSSSLMPWTTSFALGRSLISLAVWL